MRVLPDLDGPTEECDPYSRSSKLAVTIAKTRARLSTLLDAMRTTASRAPNACDRCVRGPERLALRSFVRFQFPDSGAQDIEFGLDLGHSFHLDFELAINVIEVSLHFFENVIPLTRTLDTNRPFAAGLANLSTTSDWPSGPPRALRPTWALCSLRPT